MNRATILLLAGTAALALSTSAFAQDAHHEHHKHHGEAHGIADHLEADTDTGSEATAPTMDFGTWGVGLDTIDSAIQPGNDFNAYVNGKWIAANEIPADRQRYGAFDMLREGATQDVKALVEGLVASEPSPGTHARRIVDAYASYMNVEAIDAKGLAPAQPYLAQIFGATDLDTLMRVSAQPGFPSLVSANVTIDARNPTDYAVGIGFDGMGLPDRDYYLVDSESNLEIRKKYKAFLTTMFGAVGYGDPAGAAEAVYAFEAKVAELEWARPVLRMPQLTYNVLTPEKLSEMAGDFPIAGILEASELAGQERFLARQLPPTEEEIETIPTMDISIALDAARTSKPAMDPYLQSLLELPNAGSRVITL